MNDNDLNWLAFRYVAGEMPDAELAAFEQSLAESQPAREAVAAAVLLAQAVALAEGTSADAPHELVTAGSTFRQPTWRGRLAWALVGAAASLLFAWGLQIWRDARLPPNAVALNRPANAQDLNGLAVQWTAVGEFDFDATDNDGFEHREFDDSSDAAHASSATSELFEDITAPDWLVAAVSSEQRLPMMPPTQNPDG
jgi:hypothetical protein